MKDSKIIIAVKSVEEKILKKEDQLKRLRLLVESLPDDSSETISSNTIVNNPIESTDSFLNQNDEFISKESCNLQINELEEQITLLKSVLSRLNSHVIDYIGNKENKGEVKKTDETGSTKSSKKKNRATKKQVT